MILLFKSIFNVSATSCIYCALLPYLSCTSNTSVVHTDYTTSNTSDSKSKNEKSNIVLLISSTPLRFLSPSLHDLLQCVFTHVQ